MKKPIRKNFKSRRDYYRALVQWLDDKAAEYLIQANKIRERWEL